ncbi:hypothetical protein SDC9_124567 [bioreactor metagenome]|uniref:Uncharacterized protein n=1 Tax=bioreactor metagenome TaxID=1076179 RepID=A0A645CKT2_9ZZZZ
MDFKPTQAEKHDSPIELIVEGIVLKTSAVQPEKADLPRETNDSGKLTDINFEQPEKTPSLMPDKAVGNVNALKLLQFWNE